MKPRNVPPAGMAWDGELELVALRIPFGFSLVVEKGCIHGDSTFQG